jgi:hypothetical protein
MKKTFIIALCCLTALLAACNKEKPNEKFVGDYEGSGVVNATMTVAGIYPQEFNDVDLPIKINIAAGDADNKVILTYINAELDETYTATGTVNGNDIDFDPVTINTVVESYEVEATLDLDGSLSGNDLTLNGSVKGGGTFAQSGFQAPYTIEGTMTGTVTKIVVNVSE